MTDTTTTDPIAEAEAAAKAARETRDQAKRIQAEAERAVAEAQARFREAQQQERDAIAAENEAANARLAAERRRMADEPITREVAEALAEDLLKRCEDYREGGNDRQGRPRRDKDRWWQELDNLRARLDTQDVADDPQTRSIVLTLEYVIGCADYWERSRFRSLNSDDRRDTASGECPPDDRRFQAAERDLQDVLENKPPRPLERVGELVAGNVPGEQIAKMLGFHGFGGVPEVDRLGAWIDKAFEAAGVERGLRRAVLQYAVLNMDQAWEKRQQRVESGVPDQLMPGIEAEPGSERLGRDRPLVAKSRVPERPPAVIHMGPNGEFPEDM